MDQDTAWALRLFSTIPAFDPESEKAWAWAAGLFEGEGSFTIAWSESRADRAAGKRARMYLQMSMRSTDRDVIAKFHHITKVGNFTGPHKFRGLGSKPLWDWQCQGRPAMDIAEEPAFTEHLCLRRRARLEEILALVHGQPPPLRKRRPVGKRLNP